MIWHILICLFGGYIFGNISTAYIVGKANGEGHAWNLVRVNGAYYYVEDLNAIYQADYNQEVYRLVECTIKIINGGGAI